MILWHLAGQRELAELFEAAVIEAVDGSVTRVLKADHIVAPYCHTLIALPRNTFKAGHLLQRGIGIV